MTAINYRQLVKLYDKYSSSGLKILAFPCNQFGSQEPGTPEEIKKFAEGYGVRFDMFTKVSVNGEGCDPLWEYLRCQKSGWLSFLFGNMVKWNFEKFVVDQSGQVVARFGSSESPIPAVEEAVKKLLCSG